MLHGTSTQQSLIIRGHSHGREVLRAALFSLLFLNLAYFAWARWIDAPLPSAAQPLSRLPQLMLAAEADAKAAHAPSAAAPTPTQTASAAVRCVSVGPFNDIDRAASAAALLKQRGFEPRQRAEAGETWAGYWVYVGGLRNAAEEARVLRSLTQAGLVDAHAMPGAADTDRRVSVGLFSERNRAERRARALERLGLKPEIAERRQPSTSYWVEFDLGAEGTPVPTEGLLSGEETGARLEVRVCPAVQSPPTSG